MRHYAKRNLMELDRVGGYYMRHVAAMTEEGLHEKSDIAAELGWRDERIAEIERKLAEAKGLLDELFYEWGEIEGLAIPPDWRSRRAALDAPPSDSEEEKP